MPIDHAKKQIRSARSMVWNANREELIDLLREDDFDRLIQLTEVQATWVRLSRHNAVRSAYVVQRNLRKRYPFLDTKVRNLEDEDVDWGAEIWGRRAPETDSEAA